MRSDPRTADLVVRNARIYTVEPAQPRPEQAKGSIAPGKLADVVVLSADPHRVDAAKIREIQVVRTVTGGRTTYAASRSCRAASARQS